LFVIITKTITLKETIGNLKWYAPWRCVALLPGGSVVNAVGLTNLGIDKFYYKYKNIIKKDKLKIIVSIGPKNVAEAEAIAGVLNEFNIIGIELNLFCPNVKEISDKIPIVEAALRNSIHPIGVKLAPLNTEMYDYDNHFKDKLSWLTIGNTILWHKVYKTPSPLAKYGLEGGISGPQLRAYNMETLMEFHLMKRNLPVMYSGGINSIESAIDAFKFGAKAIQIGTYFLTRPWRVNKIAKHVIKCQY
jgi:dihydroorotate dehydrogenase (NAD+) catalytic subunit